MGAAHDRPDGVPLQDLGEVGRRRHGCRLQGRGFSPQAHGRSDIFSFGILLYEMLTGHLPFGGEQEAAVVYAIVNEEPEPVQT